MKDNNFNKHYFEEWIPTDIVGNIPILTIKTDMIDKHYAPETVTVINNDSKEPIGVVVDFCDGISTGAVYKEPNTDDDRLEFGLAVCLCKKLLGSNAAYYAIIDDLKMAADL